MLEGLVDGSGSWLWREVVGEVVAYPLVWLVAAALPLIGAGGRWLWRKSMTRLFDRALSGQIWMRPVGEAERELQSRLRDGIPILLVANHKGGVGKTTLAGNLGAYLAAVRGKRVLFVDLDFQGTLSMTLRNMAGDTSDRFPVSELFDQTASKKDGEWSIPAPINLGGEIGGYLSSDEALAVNEERLMFRWALGVQRDDVRFRLANYLARPQVQENYDVVILDAPPRNTTSEINGRFAASHLVLPTRGDRFSGRAAFRFLANVTALSGHAPYIRLGAIVETLVPNIAQRHADLPSLFHGAEDEIELDLTKAAVLWRNSIDTRFHAHVMIGVAIADDTGTNWTVLDPPGQPPVRMLRTACANIVERLNQQGAQL